ncbi:transposase [Streptomyces chartreusis]|uniref:transposase n=1 Tax=Streptomyces chartreusis TaxID=1969 RepID=UPI0033DBE5CD
MPEADWPKGQTCVEHLNRTPFQYTARQDWDKISKMFKPVYTAVNEEASLERFRQTTEDWVGRRRSLSSGRRLEAGAVLHHGFTGQPSPIRFAGRS